MARTMMSVYDTPLHFWDWAVKSAVYVINRMPSSTLGGKTPLEIATNKTVDISNLVPFYAPGLYYVTRDERIANNKKGYTWAHKAIECRLLGYDENGKNNYAIWVPSMRKVIIRHDVMFDDYRRISDEDMPLEE